MAIETWQQRVGENYNDSRDETDHEIAMQAQIAELESALTVATSALDVIRRARTANDTSARLSDTQMAKIAHDAMTELGLGGGLSPMAESILL